MSCSFAMGSAIGLMVMGLSVIGSSTSGWRGPIIVGRSFAVIVDMGVFLVRWVGWKWLWIGS